MISTGRFRFFVDRNLVRSRVERKKLNVLTQTGAFGRRVMKNKYRKPLVGKRNRTVTVGSDQFFVPPRGKVIDVKTGRPCTVKQAQAARIGYARQTRGQGAGLPPRRGATDKLYRFTDFGVDPQTESAVIGAWPFPQQPAMSGRVSVPELLDKGGGEFIGGVLVRYDPRPFTAPSMDPTFRKFTQLIERVRL